ncbi:hypothetical protein Dvina_47630 [Dactylosporangium vinaceum]|uniref:Lipoprotein n=1 Tax=Dactylosporangium vinaceum TaxID=53362 RepID=A0ABV5M5N1_9ACTN|nr:hypothetical protein [Dactylosporangium vinaceum]UAB95598.1 hypothetical protein Dvina_47630 [Dactylosporangium vinaceum]
MRLVALIVGGGLVVGGLAGCGSTAEPVTGPPPVVASSGAPSPSVVVPTVRPSLGAGSVQPELAVRGTVKEGVEPGCVLLATDSQTYLLVGGDKTALKTGATVTVHGRPEPDLMTTCQQGTPFRVTKVEN